MTITSRDDFGDDISVDRRWRCRILMYKIYSSSHPNLLKITPNITHKGDCAFILFLSPYWSLAGLAGQGASSYSESRISPLLRFLNSQHHPPSPKKNQRIQIFSSLMNT
jgi:hypothetical protein